MEDFAHWLVRFQDIDRRYIYLAVAATLTLPIVLQLRMPQIPTPPTQAAFKAVENVPDEKVVLIAADFDTGTVGENGPQLRTVLEHLMRRKKKFVILSLIAPQGVTIAELYSRTIGEKYGYKYGRDYVNLGYLPGGAPTLERMGRSVWETFPTDTKRIPLSELPMMRQVRSAQDIGLVAIFTGSGVLPSYVQTFWAQFKVPLIEGCTGIIVPELFPYLEAKQLVGILPGLKGAAEYEALLQQNGLGMRGMVAQSVAHALVIILILLGNLGMWLSRRPSAQRL
ncbi:MAG: hypothetical protein PVTTEEND_001477 [Candidatus Fervidibacter sp.]|jgi:hypothetical protein